MTLNFLNTLYKRKSFALLIDFMIFAELSLLCLNIIRSSIDDIELNPWIFRLGFFFFYFSICEMLFKKTIGMHFFNLELNRLSRQKLNFKFIVYSVVSILDRTILVVIHLLLAFLNYELNLFCEKISREKWVYLKRLK